MQERVRLFIARSAIDTDELTRDIESEDGEDVYVVRLAGPVMTPWRAQLEGYGADLLERLVGTSYSFRVARSAPPILRSLDFVLDIRRYTPLDTCPPALVAVDETATGEPRTFDVRFHPRAEADAVSALLADRNALVVRRGPSSMRVSALMGYGIVEDLARRPEVASLEEARPPRPTSDKSRALVGVPAVETAKALNLDGAGEIIAVADTGFDDAHPDLAGRVIALHDLGRPGDTSDPDGHGTFVAGCAGGDGSASTNHTTRGVAHKAEFVLQAVMDAQGGMSGLEKPDLRYLFDLARAEGARIHNNSWGVANDARYLARAQEVDEWAYEHPDMLIVFSAGNSGRANGNRNSMQGFVDLLSIDDPSTAKNALTVGASRSDRAGVTGAPSPQRWGSWYPALFPDPPIATDDIAGDPEALAATSSRGPCQEELRIKPDVVAPGTMVLGARASTAPATAFTAVDPVNHHYAYLGGTSVAAPLASGCAALVRQYLVNERGHQPSAALLKAVLINGTRWLTGQDSNADNTVLPNFHQGFGRIDLEESIPNPSQPDLVLEFSDDWEPQGTLAFNQLEDAYAVTFDVAGARELRMCLVWHDPPARGIQQQLNLWAVDPNGAEYRSNERRLKTIEQVDGSNNVHVIRIPEPPPGSYEIQIAAKGLAQLDADQRFAFVVTGDLVTPLTITDLS
jgi:serine protease AprX